MESNRCAVCSGNGKERLDIVGLVGYEGGGALRYIKYRAKNPSMPRVYTAADAQRLLFLGWMDMLRTERGL